MANHLNTHSRRRFIKGAGLAGLTTPLLAQQGLVSRNGSTTQAKNLIFLVVDGMCNGTLGLAHHWHHRNRGKALNWMQLYQRPDLCRGTQDTASLSSPVTDSAAAASAWGSGQRVNNGAVNIDPQGKSLLPIFLRAKYAGKRVGLVTTCRVSHATPAGFFANVADRDDEPAIVRQYLEREADLLLGGGARFFQQAAPSDAPAVDFSAWTAAGYLLARDRDQLRQLPLSGQPVLGVFADSHIPYALDRRNDRALSAIPSLPEMFAAALHQLQGARDGFVLQVEGGRVDHAGHANDPAAILHEQLEFDACIPRALEFIEQHPDTLLIVTTDHGTGGCQLDGAGKRYNDSGPALDRINRFRQSFEWLEQRFRVTGKFDADLLTQATGIDAVSERAAEVVQAALHDPNVSYLSSVLTREFAAELTAATAVGWSSTRHTAENVELMAFGPGSRQVPAFMRNDELHNIMTDALGI